MTRIGVYNNKSDNEVGLNFHPCFGSRKLVYIHYYDLSTLDAGS